MSTASRPTASLVIPLCAADATTEPCLSSVLRSVDASGEDVEVILVLNGTSPADRALIAGPLAHPAVRVLSHDERLGYAPALVRGMESAVGDILLFTDADVHVPETWVAILLQGMRAGRDVCTSTARAANARRTRIVRLEEHIDERRTSQRLPDGSVAVCDIHSLAVRRSLGVAPTDDVDNFAADVEMSIQMLARGITITPLDDIVVRTYYPETVRQAIRRRAKHGIGAAFIQDQWERLGVTPTGAHTPGGYLRDLPRRGRDMGLGFADRSLYLLLQLAYVRSWARHLQTLRVRRGVRVPPRFAT